MSKKRNKIFQPIDRVRGVVEKYNGKSIEAPGKIINIYGNAYIYEKSFSGNQKRSALAEAKRIRKQGYRATVIKATYNNGKKIRHEIYVRKTQKLLKKEKRKKKGK